jgi:hypothetical protein
MARNDLPHIVAMMLDTVERHRWEPIANTHLKKRNVVNALDERPSAEDRNCVLVQWAASFQLPNMVARKDGLQGGPRIIKAIDSVACTHELPFRWHVVKIFDCRPKSVVAFLKISSPEINKLVGGSRYQCLRAYAHMHYSEKRTRVDVPDGLTIDQFNLRNFITCSPAKPCNDFRILE